SDSRDHFALQVEFWLLNLITDPMRRSSVYSIDVRRPPALGGALLAHALVGILELCNGCHTEQHAGNYDDKYDDDHRCQRRATSVSDDSMYPVMYRMKGNRDD